MGLESEGPPAQAEHQVTPERDGASAAPATPAAPSGPVPSTPPDENGPTASAVPGSPTPQEASAVESDVVPQAMPVPPGAPSHVDDNLSRSERIARLRAALLSGNYPVDLDKLAEKIVQGKRLAPLANDPNDDNDS